MAVLRHHDTAVESHHLIGGKGHSLLIGAHHNDIVAVMADTGGHRAVLQAVTLDIAQADMVGILVPLNNGDLQDIVVHVNAVGIAAVGGGDLTVDHADDGMRPVVDEIGGGQGGHVEGIVGAVHQIGVHLRDREIRDLTVLTHQHAPLVDLLDVEMLKIVDDHEVAQITGSNGAAVIQQEIPGGVVAGGLDGGDGRYAEGNGLFHDIVDVAFFQQIAGVLVIGAEHAALHIFITQQRRQRLQIAGGRTLADHDELAPLQLGDGVVQVVALMVGVHAGGHIGVQIVAHQIGGVAVDLLVMGLAGHDLGYHVRIAVDHAVGVHHLGKALHPGMVIEGVDGPVVQIGAGLVHGGGGHAGGQHETHVHRQVLRGLQHILNAVGAHDIGDLVGVGNDSGGTVGQYRAGKLTGADQRALQMDVGVHKAGQYDLTGDVHLHIAAVFAHAHDQALSHGDIRLTQLVGKHVHIGGVFQHQIRLSPARCHFDHVKLLIQLAVDLAGITLLDCHNMTSVAINFIDFSY